MSEWKASTSFGKARSSASAAAARRAAEDRAAAREQAWSQQVAARSGRRRDLRNCVLVGLAPFVVGIGAWIGSGSGDAVEALAEAKLIAEEAAGGDSVEQRAEQAQLRQEAVRIDPVRDLLAGLGTASLYDLEQKSTGSCLDSSREALAVVQGIDLDTLRCNHRGPGWVLISAESRDKSSGRPYDVHLRIVQDGDEWKLEDVRRRSAK